MPVSMADKVLSFRTCQSLAPIRKLFGPEEGGMAMSKEEGGYATIQSSGIRKAIQGLLPFGA